MSFFFKQKEKKNKRNNVLDFFIILLFISLVVALICRFLYNDYGILGENASKNEEYILNVSLSDISKEEVQSLKRGDEIRLAFNNEYLGKITSSEFIIKEQSVDDKTIYSASFDIQVIGFYNEEGFMINGNCFSGEDALISIRSNEIRKEMKVNNIKKVD